MATLRRLLGMLSLSAAAGAAACADFATPEGAIRELEDAYRDRDIERAVAAKDFALEARLMLEGLEAKNGSPGLADESLVRQAAEVLELSYRKSIEDAGFPAMEGVECSFPSKRDVKPGIVEVTERCQYPDGGLSEQRLLVGRTDRGWRVLYPVGGDGS